MYFIHTAGYYRVVNMIQFMYVRVSTWRNLQAGVQWKPGYDKIFVGLISVKTESKILFKDMHMGLKCKSIHGRERHIS